ncbi:hypothetical protein [Arachidicoccus sp.]|uniref:hypothetical protein n=1 Tax=Arachidicoccus sp. TaxID=1872624 RepID=UPI003D20D489
MKSGFDKIICCFFFVTMSFAACKNGSSSNATEKEAKSLSPLDSMMQIVMDGHDKSMGKMGHLLVNQKEINHKIDSLKKTLTPGNKAEITLLQSTNMRIDSVTGSMNKWMESFDMEMDKMDSVAKMNYLQKNRMLIDSITTKMQQASNFSDSILAQKSGKIIGK